MKIKKLNQRGFSHEILIVAVVVISAIIGVGYMVNSNAATKCTKSKAAKGKCKLVSGPASGPMSGPNSVLASCTIKGIPTNPKQGSTISPSVVVYNSGRTTLTPKMHVYINGYNNEGIPSQTYSKSFSLKKLKPNHSSKTKLPKYKVANRSNGRISMIYTASGDKFYCQKTVNLPYISSASKKQ